MGRARRSTSEKQSSKPFTVGRAAFAKVSAGEGMRAPPAMEREFREYDRKGLSAEERRRLIR
jgi:hypothetical protein